MSEKKSPIIKDFEAVAPTKRVAKIAGREVDVTSIPARVTLDMARFKDAMDAGELTALQQIEQLVDLVARVTSRTNPEITSDWILDNLDMGQMMDFVQFVLNPSLEKAQAHAGNPGTAQ